MFFSPQNAIPIIPLTDDLGDVERKRLINFFEQFDGVDDMRDVVKVSNAKRSRDLFIVFLIRLK